MNHYKLVEFLSNFRCQVPPIEDFLATVLHRWWAWKRVMSLVWAHRNPGPPRRNVFKRRKQRGSVQARLIFTLNFLPPTNRQRTWTSQQLPIVFVTSTAADFVAFSYVTCSRRVSAWLVKENLLRIWGERWTFQRWRASQQLLVPRATAIRKLLSVKSAVAM